MYNITDLIYFETNTLSVSHSIYLRVDSTIDTFMESKY